MFLDTGMLTEVAFALSFYCSASGGDCLKSKFIMYFQNTVLQLHCITVAMSHIITVNEVTAFCVVTIAYNCFF
jgi:hypothetical protein